MALHPARLLPSPLAALHDIKGRPLRIALLSDFVRIPYANGAVFQTRSLYRSLRQCGHQVTVIGPHDPDATVDELAPGTVELPSLPLKTYPGVHIPMPLGAWMFDENRWDFDLCFAQTTSLLVQFGLWLREATGTALLCVNTTHLEAAYDVLLPESIAKQPLVHKTVEYTLRRPYERLFAGIFNRSDGLMVLSDGLASYWRSRGVAAPIHVVPRAVSEDVFAHRDDVDPYAALLEQHALPDDSLRLLCAGRHTREKSQDRVIKIFAEQVLPREPRAVLFLVGVGPDTGYYRRCAKLLGVERRVVFTGEVSFASMPAYYRNADVFVHTSLSETYGNVLGEALWCGTPVVAMEDGMGVSFQVKSGKNGVLIDPRKPTPVAAEERFGRATIELLQNRESRVRLGQAAATMARLTSSQFAVEEKLAKAFRAAIEHAAPLRKQARGHDPSRRFYTALSHARPWAAIMGGVYAMGHLRKEPMTPSVVRHPKIAS
ncbi:MAG TPA: glycosyltransferase [Polyangiaceae bacterium]|nr:glycosyltransferase [Polyangiaceae bacterium]